MVVHLISDGTYDDIYVRNYGTLQVKGWGEDSRVGQVQIFDPGTTPCGSGSIRPRWRRRARPRATWWPPFVSKTSRLRQEPWAAACVVPGGI